jgi:flagellar biosynthesis GTPase FlhF
MIAQYIKSKDPLTPTQTFLFNGISKCEYQKKLTYKVPEQLHELGMEEKFNLSQNQAIIKAMNEKITLIQGPPGTGKTRVMAGIVTNWYKLIEKEWN